MIKVGFVSKSGFSLLKRTNSNPNSNPIGHRAVKSRVKQRNQPKVAKSGPISTIFLENLTRHQARAHSGRKALNRTQRGLSRGKSQVGLNPENPFFSRPWGGLSRGFHHALKESRSYNRGVLMEDLWISSMIRGLLEQETHCCDINSGFSCFDKNLQH